MTAKPDLLYLCKSHNPRLHLEQLGQMLDPPLSRNVIWSLSVGLRHYKDSEVVQMAQILGVTQTQVIEAIHEGTRLYRQRHPQVWVRPERRNKPRKYKPRKGTLAERSFAIASGQ